MDWLDTIKEERDRGVKRALQQDAHAAVNARYPGCTLEYCCKCDSPTGHAGRAENSLYTDDGEVPYCEDCWRELSNRLLDSTKANTAGGKRDDD